jgi:peptidylprolyl isomerase
LPGVAGTKRDRQREGREARRAAEAAAARKAAARRRAVTVVVGLVVLAGIAFVVSRGGNSKTTATTGSTTTTAVAGSAAGSAAGKPCVAVTDVPPAGAPAVPVKVGPPPTNLVKEDLKAGTGAEVAPGATVTVQYIGVACSTGKIFDSSYARNAPATFPLSGVIKGWQDGIPGMKVGGQRLLGIPPAQAYGATGQPPTIAPDETLWFVVEVVDTK